MPWSLSGLLVDFVVALVLGMGWTLGCWLMSLLLGALQSRKGG